MNWPQNNQNNGSCSHFIVWGQKRNIFLTSSRVSTAGTHYPITLPMLLKGLWIITPARRLPRHYHTHFIIISHWFHTNLHITTVIRDHKFLYFCIIYFWCMQRTLCHRNFQMFCFSLWIRFTESWEVKITRFGVWLSHHVMFVGFVCGLP